MKTTLQSKKIKKRRDDDLDQSSSSANALRNASSYLKHKQGAAAVQWVKSFVTVDEYGSRSMRRVLNKDEVIVHEFLRTKEEIWI